jgi:hypothetical protein
MSEQRLTPRPTSSRYTPPLPSIGHVPTLPLQDSPPPPLGVEAEEAEEEAEEEVEAEAEVGEEAEEDLQ